MSRLTGPWSYAPHYDSVGYAIWMISTASEPRHPYIGDCYRPGELDPEDIPLMSAEEVAARKALEAEAESVVRLAASAPDLLAEAQRIRKILEGYLHGGENDHLLHWETLQELYLPLVDCIRKATGQTR
jgi:hypothetical protein